MRCLSWGSFRSFGSSAPWSSSAKAQSFTSKKAAAPHPVPLDLYDPLGLNSKKTREQLDKSLLSEINNGRLAMLGIMAFCAEQKIPGAVPALKGLVKPYAGEFMSPFE